MVNYNDLIRDLLQMGKEDAVEHLGKMYEDNHKDYAHPEGFKVKVDSGFEALETGALLNKSLVWSETPQGHHYWEQICDKLGGRYA